MDEEGSSVDGSSVDGISSTNQSPQHEVKEVIVAEDTGSSTQSIPTPQPDDTGSSTQSIPTPQPDDEVDATVVQRMESEVIGQQRMTPAEVESEIEKLKLNDSEQDTSGQGESLDIQSDRNTDDIKELPVGDNTNIAEEENKVMVNGKGTLHDTYDSDENFGSVSDDENNYNGLTSEVEENGFLDLPVLKTPYSRPHNTSIDELMLGYGDDGHSVVSDIITDINMRLGGLSRKSSPSRRDTSPNSFDSLRSDYTKPKSQQKKNVSNKGRPLPIQNVEETYIPVHLNPREYYKDDDGDYVSLQSFFFK